MDCYRAGSVIFSGCGQDGSCLGQSKAADSRQALEHSCRRHFCLQLRTKSTCCHCFSPSATWRSVHRRHFFPISDRVEGLQQYSSFFPLPLWRYCCLWALSPCHPSRKAGVAGMLPLWPPRKEVVAAASVSMCQPICPPNWVNLAAEALCQQGRSGPLSYWLLTSIIEHWSPSFGGVP